MKLSLSSFKSDLVLPVIMVIGLVFGIFFYFPTPYGRTNGSSSDYLNWLAYAQVAWRYYSSGVGVNPETGINRAKLDWDAATDWDTGGYIVATIDAHRLGLVGRDGPWGFKDRIQKILQYLLSRELGEKGGVKNWPYWAYSWDNRPLPNPDRSYTPSYSYTDSSDSGRLLYALDLLRRYDSSFESQVQNVFQRCKTAYDVLSTHVDARVHYYGTLDAVGFSSFGYNKSHVISAFQNWTGPFVVVEGQTLPQTETTAEPTLHGILELHLGGNFLEFGRRVYEVQKSRWARTGRLTGWSEGSYPDPGYIYEWILTPTGETWVINSGGKRLTIDPLMYTKVAFAYLAIFGDNPYTTSLFNAANNLQHSQYGFGEATLESGASATSLWGTNIRGFFSDKTNQIVLAAAAYAFSASRTSLTSSTPSILTTTATSPSTVPTSTAASQVSFTTVATTTVVETTSPARACIIASVAYGSQLAPEVQFLREFRDSTVMSTFAGRQFVKVFDDFYYSFSPTIAKLTLNSPILQAIVRALIHPLLLSLHVAAAICELYQASQLMLILVGVFASGLISAVYVSPVLVLFRVVRRYRT